MLNNHSLHIMNIFPFEIAKAAFVVRPKSTNFALILIYVYKHDHIGGYELYQSYFTLSYYYISEYTVFRVIGTGGVFI